VSTIPCPTNEQGYEMEGDKKKKKVKKEKQETM